MNKWLNALIIALIFQQSMSLSEPIGSENKNGEMISKANLTLVGSRNSHIVLYDTEINLSSVNAVKL